MVGVHSSHYDQQTAREATKRNDLGPPSVLGHVPTSSIGEATRATGSTPDIIIEVRVHSHVSNETNGQEIIHD
jgi:hypothetical protein